MSKALAPDQPAAADALAPWLAAQRSQLLVNPAHALLLHGPSGLGHQALALSLAQAWLCESPQRQPHEAACGQCASCQQIQARGHTDLVLLMPEVLMLELGWPLSEKAQKEIDDKKRKPSKEIRIDSVREALAFAELTSGRGQGKVIVVFPAEAMNHASANALLKTLEEPQGALRFILATEASHQLLPTIRSRCQAFAIAAPSFGEADSWLAEHAPKASPAQRQAALQASGNRPLDALKIIASGADSIWANLPKAMQKGQLEAVSDWQAAQLLDALQKLCHDLWAIKLGAPTRFFAAQDLPKPPPARALAAWGEQLKILGRQIEHPFKLELLLQDMVQQAKLCINSRA
jgi:DNA polymerase III subunit delta'